MRGEIDTDTLIKRGMKVGSNFHRMSGVFIDAGNPQSYIMNMHDFVNKHQTNMKQNQNLIFDKSYTFPHIDDLKKQEMIEKLQNTKIGYLK
jgi:hypothetical protein